MVNFIAHPLATALLLFGIIFLIPTVKVVFSLSMDSTPLQWLITMFLAVVNCAILATAFSFLTQ